MIPFLGLKSLVEYLFLKICMDLNFSKIWIKPLNLFGFGKFDEKCDGKKMGRKSKRKSEGKKKDLK